MSRYALVQCSEVQFSAVQCSSVVVPPHIHSVTYVPATSDRFQAPTSASAWMVGTSTATRPDTTTGPDTIEGINLDAEIPCETTFTEGECPNPADLVIASHLTPRFFLCRECWDAEVFELGRCPATLRVEGRDAHYRIVEVLR